MPIREPVASSAPRLRPPLSGPPPVDDGEARLAMTVTDLAGGGVVGRNPSFTRADLQTGLTASPDARESTSTHVDVTRPMIAQTHAPGICVAESRILLGAVHARPSSASA